MMIKPYSVSALVASCLLLAPVSGKLDQRFDGADVAQLHGPFHPPIAVTIDSVQICVGASSCSAAGVSLVHNVVNVEVRVFLVGIIPGFEYEVLVEIPKQLSLLYGACQGSQRVAIPTGMVYLLVWYAVI